MHRGAAVAAIALAAALAGADTGAAGGGETLIGVRADEFDLTFTSPPPFDPGPAEIEYVNQGEDPHDLKIRRKGRSKTRSIAELGPGGVSELELRLKRDSRYVMWCSTLDGEHRELGMEATMKVRRN